jgi:tetratricopeptide (TPR) repeat protein
MHRPDSKLNSAPAGAPALLPPRPRFPGWFPAALVALATIILFWPATHFEFVNYDDNVYVTENPHVQSGLTWQGVKWAFSNTQQADYWAPMMWLSHMTACQLFGLKPWGHHLINVLLHALDTALVFLLFRRLTGATWRSLFVAVLFGWHPLRVESVAWVTERKDVLSTFFGLLSLLCYAKAVTGDKCQVTGSEKNILTAFLSRVTCHVSPYYFLSLFFFALGLMSKPMLVTWPFVMLLLDYWPLERFKVQGSKFRVQGLILEKVPFFVLAAAMSVVTYVVQQHGGTVATIENLPLGARVGNALISYCRYLGKLFWPSDLAFFYPHPANWPRGEVILAGGLLLVVTTACVVARRRFPFLLTGWLWFSGTLVPVIGLVQAGGVAMADRFSYVPSLGLLVLVIWGACELTRWWRHQVMALSATGCAAVVICFGLTQQQLGYWKNSETLFQRALEVTRNNYLAHNNLGFTLNEEGKIDEAINQYQEAIRLKPDYAEAHNNLGIALATKGQIDEAIRQFQEAIRLKPDYAKAHYNLGNVLGSKGQMDEAIRQLQEAIRLNPDFAEAYNNLGNTLGLRGRTDEAIGQFQEAARLKPNSAEIHNNLGNTLIQKNRIDEAIGQLQEALRLKPDFAEAHFNLGTALGWKGQTDEAIDQFQEAVRLAPNDANVHYNLGTALGRKGQTDEAINQFQQAIRLNPDYFEAHYNLGTAFGRKGWTDEAIRQYQEVIRLKPDFAEAHCKLGNLLLGKGRTDEALSQFQEAIQLKPDYAEARYNLAHALELKNASTNR